jgi:hypothetical protein
MLSHWLVRFTGIAALSFAVCGVASAQYGGGGTPGSGGTGANGGYTPPSGGYSSGKAIGIGVGAAAGAAVGIALLVRHHHHSAEKEQQTYVTGCTQSIEAGINLTDEKDNQTYSVVTNNKALKAGERITLKGVLVAADGPGNPTFQMRSVIKDYGACGTASASNSSAANPTSLN